MALALMTFSLILFACDKDEPKGKKNVPVTEIKMSKTQIEVAVGKSEAVMYTILPKEATNKKVTWKTENKAIATVDGNGKVTGVKKGETKVTVTTADGGKNATCNISVK